MSIAGGRASGAAGGAMTGHARISLAAWGATVLGALVLTPVFSGPFLFISAFLCGAITGIGILLQNLRAPRSSYRSFSCGAGGTDLVLLPAGDAEVRADPGEGDRLRVQPADGQRDGLDQPVQRPAPGLASDPVRGLGDRRDRVADPRHRRTASSGRVGGCCCSSCTRCGPRPCTADCRRCCSSRRRSGTSCYCRPRVAGSVAGAVASRVCPTSMRPNRSRRPRSARRAPDRPDRRSALAALLPACCRRCRKVSSATAWPAPDPEPGSARRSRRPTRCWTWART